jgi:hypothetical protein
VDEDQRQELVGKARRLLGALQQAVQAAREAGVNLLVVEPDGESSFNTHRYVQINKADIHATRTIEY